MRSALLDMALFDRFLFAFTIGSHILLASLSIGLIVVISLAEFISIRANNPDYGELSRRLTKVFAVIFGVGTASGIVMAFELVTLFPTFMTLVSQTGAVAIFYAEIFAFFLEAIALVMYVYYANYLSRWAHWALSVFIAAGALLSALLITLFNAWMNTPNGFDLAVFVHTGKVTGLDVWAPFNSPSALAEVAHVIPTVLLAGTMITGGYLAWRYIRVNDVRERRMLSAGLKIAGAVGIVTIVLAIATGINEITTLLTLQPLKYAAIELNPMPGTNLPEKVFGVLINGQVQWAIVIPGLQSFLVRVETGITSLPGLSQFPEANWPPLFIHITFDLMVAGGAILGLFFLAYLVDWAFISKKPQERKLFLYSWVPLAFVALAVMELGWVTDEVGRQPWIVYNVMTAKSAANVTSGFLIPGILIIIFYVALLPLTIYVFSRVFNAKPDEERQKQESTGQAGANA